MKLYTTTNDIDFSMECMNTSWGQFFNQNLILPIRPRRYKTVDCTFQENQNVTKCSGVLNIQDYKVRHFSLAFGFDCFTYYLLNDKANLNGLSYSVTIFGKTNTTRCQKNRFRRNNSFEKIFSEYNYSTSLPNLYGDQDIEDANTDMMALSVFESTYSFHKRVPPFFQCHKYFFRSLCYLVYPPYQPENQLVTHVCKEMCHEIFHACWNITWQHAHLFPIRPLRVSKRDFFHYALQVWLFAISKQ